MDSNTDTGRSNRANALWFFFALLGGGTGVWWTKGAFPNPWIAAVAAAGVVLALTIYYVFNEENAPEEEGDNVYYLGLLFTLISLMLTLVNLFGLDAEVVPNAERISDLLKNFGIALTSTVAGISGRIVVQNWQRTGSMGRSEFFGDTEVRALPPADASSRDLDGFNRHLLGRIARDLTQGANALARFHRIVRSHASDSEDYLRNHSESLKRESAAFRDTLQRNAETFAEELKAQADNTLESVGSSLSAAAQQAEVLLGQLQSVHSSYLAEVRETTRSFHEDIQSANSQSLDALRHNFESAAEHAEAFPDRLQSAHSSYLEEVRETTRSFHDDLRSASGQSLDVLRQNFEAAAKQSVTLAQNASVVHQEIREAFDHLGSGLEHAGNASSALSNSAQEAAKSTAVLELEAEKLRAAFEAVCAGAKSMAGMFEAVGELDARIRATHDTEQTTAAVQLIGETLRTITAERAAATELAAKAAELFDTLTQSVRTTEGETRRATEALRVLANETEAQVKTLRQPPSSGLLFWKRRG